MRGQLPISCMCFCFFAHKNCSTRAVILVARTLLSKIFLVVFAFLIAKIVMQGQQLCKASYLYLFLFFAYKNCNAGVALPAISMPAIVAFLPNISLAVFAFLITKIVTWGQQLQIYQQQLYQPGCRYLFLLFNCKNHNVGAINISTRLQVHL